MFAQCTSFAKYIKGLLCSYLNGDCRWYLWFWWLQLFRSHLWQLMSSWLFWWVAIRNCCDSFICGGGHDSWLWVYRRDLDLQGLFDDGLYFGHSFNFLFLLSKKFCVKRCSSFKKKFFEKIVVVLFWSIWVCYESTNLFFFGNLSLFGLSFLSVLFLFPWWRRFGWSWMLVVWRTGRGLLMVAATSAAAAAVFAAATTALVVVTGWRRGWWVFGPRKLPIWYGSVCEQQNVPYFWLFETHSLWWSKNGQRLVLNQMSMGKSCLNSDWLRYFRANHILF